MPHRHRRAAGPTLVLLPLIVAATAGPGGPAAAGEPETIEVPELASDWWQIAPNAPEVIEHEGRFYLAGYGRGIHVAEMRWAEKTPAEVEHWRKTEFARILEEREAARLRRQQRERERKEKEASP